MSLVFVSYFNVCVNADVGVSCAAEYSWRSRKGKMHACLALMPWVVLECLYKRMQSLTAWGCMLSGHQMKFGCKCN